MVCMVVQKIFSYHSFVSHGWILKNNLAYVHMIANIEKKITNHVQQVFDKTL